MLLDLFFDPVSPFSDSSEELSSIIRLALVFFFKDDFVGVPLSEVAPVSCFDLNDTLG